MKKRLSIAIACVLMATTITACGGGASSKNNDSSSASSKSTASTSSSEASSSSSEVETSSASSEAASSESTSSDEKIGLYYKGDPEKQYTIAYCVNDDSDVFQHYTKDIFMKYCDSLENVTGLEADGRSDIETQLNQIDNFIVQEVDAILVAPVDSDGLTPAVQTCANAGIPLITTVSDINSPDSVGCKGDYYQRGSIPAEELCKVLDEGANICIMLGTAGVSHTNQGKEGFLEYLEKNRPDINILDTQNGDYLRTEGQRITEDWLQAYDDIDAIYCQNDQMALGAVEALKADGREGVLVTGVDATMDALQEVKSGEMFLTLFQDGDTIAATALSLALEAADGKTVKSVGVDYILVNKDNCDEYIALREKEQ